MALETLGWNSPNPAEKTRAGGKPFSRRTSATLRARICERSQFDLKYSEWTGIESVWPATITMKVVSFFATSPRARATLSRSSRPCPVTREWPDAKSRLVWMSILPSSASAICPFSIGIFSCSPSMVW